MATRYTFTDDSGDVRISGFLDPEPAGTFNGGTITEALYVVPPSTTATAVNVEVISGSLQFNAIDVYDHATGDDLFRVFKEGAPVTAQHVAPADGDLSSGEVALWFDQTNGAAKLMVKGKSANGTVVSAAIALA